MLAVMGEGGEWLLSVSEPFRVEGKELAEHGPRKVDWPRNAEQRSGHWIQQAVDKPPEGSALDALLRMCVHHLWLKGGSQIPALILTQCPSPRQCKEGTLHGALHSRE